MICGEGNPSLFSKQAKQWINTGVYQSLKTGSLRTTDPHAIFVFNPEISNQNLSVGVLQYSQKMW